MNSMNSFVSQLRRFVIRHWRPLTLYGILFIGLGVALLWQLDSLVPGYSANEVATYNASLNLRSIWENPLNAPYHILVFSIRHIFEDGYIATRLASVLIGWLTLCIFCTILYRWHGTRTAIIGTLIFGLSAWFLHISRLGTPEVMFFGILALAGCGVWLRERKAGLAVIVGLLLGAVLMYTPGLVWFLFIGLLWQWKTIDQAFRKNLGAVTIGALVFFAGITPLVWRLYQRKELIREWLAIPDTWNQPVEFLKNLVDVVSSIFFRGQENPEMWLGRLPLLSVFGIVMFILGIYVFARYAKLGRVKLFGGLMLLGSLAIALSAGLIPLTVLVPFIYLVVAVGAGYMIDIWLSIFPRNPIARTIGIVLVSLVVGLSCLYNVRSYFVAWPGATVTQEVFSHKQPDNLLQ